MKGRGRNIRARASSDSCSSRRATTSRSASLRPPRNIFTCCGGRRCAPGASRWSSSRRKACCGIRRHLRRLRISRPDDSRPSIPDPRRRLGRRACCCAPEKSATSCSAERKRHRKDTSTAIVFVEQLYPFPEAELAAEMDRHANAREFVWVQEEPGNMGALAFLMPRLERLARGRAVLSVNRSVRAPARPPDRTRRTRWSRRRSSRWPSAEPRPQPRADSLLYPRKNQAVPAGHHAAALRSTKIPHFETSADIRRMCRHRPSAWCPAWSWQSQPRARA